MATRTPLVFRDNNVVGTPSTGDKLPAELIPQQVPIPFGISNQWTIPVSIGPSSIGATSTLSTIGRVVYAAFVVTKPITITKLGLHVTAGAAGTVSVGVYGLNSSGEPGTLLLSHNFTDVSTTGTKEATVSLTLAPGVYYMAIVGDAAATVVGVQRSMPLFWSDSGGMSHALFSVDGTSALADNPTINYAIGAVATIPSVMAQFTYPA